jgi:hypothetical protein
MSFPSETIFQKQITDMMAAFESSDRHLGFGLNVNHSGFEIVERMPTVAALGAIDCHQAIGRLVVVVYDDPSCGAVTDAQLLAAVYAVAAAAIPDGKVWDRLRFAANDDEFVEFYRDLQERYNVWFVRRAEVSSERGGGIDDELVSRTHFFEFRYLRAILESDLTEGSLLDEGGDDLFDESDDAILEEVA